MPRTSYSGRRRHQPVINIKDTGGDNSIKVVRDQTTRRNILSEQEQNPQPAPQEQGEGQPNKPVDQRNDAALKAETTVESKSTKVVNRDNLPAS